jgi:hypothetical protein
MLGPICPMIDFKHGPPLSHGVLFFLLIFYFYSGSRCHTHLHQWLIVWMGGQSPRNYSLLRGHAIELVLELVGRLQ